MAETNVAKNTGNVLFLDFDGVCNSAETGSYLTHDPSEYGPDPKLLKRIREICEKGNARIIVSSNWRRYPPDGTCRFGMNDYANPLPGLYKEMGDLIDGTLTKERYITKAEAVELWFEDHPEFSGKFAILDDDPREGFERNMRLRPSFWLVNRHFGISERIKRDIIRHFGGNQ